MVKEKLESLIISYKKKFEMRNLEYIAVSGTTHLVEVCMKFVKLILIFGFLVEIIFTTHLKCSPDYLEMSMGSL